MCKVESWAGDENVGTHALVVSMYSLAGSCPLLSRATVAWMAPLVVFRDKASAVLKWPVMAPLLEINDPFVSVMD